MSWTLLTPILLVLGALVIIGLERAMPYEPGQKFLRKDFLLDFLQYGILQSYVLAVLITDFVNWVDRQNLLPDQKLAADWPLWTQVVFFVVLHDFYIYWFHRAQHHSPLLWRLHEAHHSIKQLDWCAGLRSHSFEILINQTVELGALVLLGASVDVILICAAISGLWGMWIHSNVNVRSGILQRLINGPEMHRWHHAVDYPDRGSNFATKLAVWDYLFGTSYRPDTRPAGYGLAEHFPEGWLKQHLYAFRRL